MVMEAPPSPQSVGREFVRQYYTLLNKAPTHLHRFYNHQSSFIHGGLEPNRDTHPVIGQKQIHHKIQQLNFRDCHAKITQVDSQSTLGGGVVVQVTGELSNAGQPMRRFTQTFVLVSQSPKKYYVHNDIFRYQDEIITDEDFEEIRPEVEEEERPLAPLAEPMVQPITPAPGMPYYGPPSMAAPQPVVVVPPPAANLNGHPEELLIQGHLPQPIPPPLAHVQSPPAPPVEEIPEPEPQEEEEHIEEPIMDGGYDDVAETEVEQEMPQEPASNEPKTFANLFKSSTMGQGNYPPPQGYQAQSPPRQREAVQSNGVGRVSGPPRGAPRPAHTRAPRSDDEGDRRRSQPSFGQLDANQLFLGNLPHVATEDELREIFAEFGAVLDLRIHSKPTPSGMKPQGGRAPPNYGFITYESQTSVVACLAAKPIFYPQHDTNGTMLNVEEKKNKESRSSYGGSGRGGFDSGRGRGDAPRRGTGGPRGGGMQGLGDRNRPDRDNRDNRYNRGGPARGGGPNTYSRR